MCVFWSLGWYFDLWGMEKTMFLSEVLTEMKKLDARKNPVPFTIKVRGFSVQNKSGGTLYTYERAVLLQPPKQKGAKRLAMDTPMKDANHYENRTRNLKLSSGEIKKINILFIEEFNGRKVIY